MANSRPAPVVIFCLLLATATSGCGSGVDLPDLGFVSGTVTMDGTPVENIIVVMHPEKGRAAMVRTDKAGHYDMQYTQDEKGTKVGPTIVSLEWPLGEAGIAIPKRYVGEKSELKLDVKSGQQTFDIKMVSDGKPEDAKPAAGGKTPKNAIPVD